MNFEVVDNEDSYLKNLFKDFVAKGSRLTQIEHLVFFPLWLYFRLMKDGLKAAWHGIDYNTSKISIDRINKNFSVVKVDKDFKYYNKDGILVQPVLNKAGTYFISSEAELEHFVNSYKFTKAKVFSIAVNNKTCDIYKRDDLGAYIITNLPEGIDPQKYGLTLDENSNYVIPVKLSNDRNIEDLKGEINKLAIIEYHKNKDQDKPNEKSDLEKENILTKDINKDILDKNVKESTKENILDKDLNINQKIEENTINNKNISNKPSMINKVMNSAKNRSAEITTSYKEIDKNVTKESDKIITNKLIEKTTIIQPSFNFERTM